MSTPTHTDPVTTIPRVLSIAGTDPSGGAGIQADLKSIAANGGYGMAVVTALTAQNTQGVRSVHAPPPAFLREQLDAVSDDVALDAVKIGMLFDTAIVAEVGQWLDRVRPPFVVLDPVMVATSGDSLLTPEAQDAVRDLLGRVDLVTPNVPELAVLVGEAPATSWDEVLDQARRLSARHDVLVLAKGGHLDGATVPDALVDGRLGLQYPEPVVQVDSDRVATRHTHGTGCSLSSALATLRPQCDSWAQALEQAKGWLTESIREADALRVGHGNGPVSHFAGLWARGGTTTAPTPDAVATRWWADIEPTRDAIDELPFIKGLVDGSLDRAAFGWYLAQDALYLRDYSRVLARASELAPTAAEQDFWAGSASGAIAAEMQLHLGWLPEGALDGLLPSRTTTAYLDHLLATGARSDYAVTIAALLPCFWIYDDLGRRLLGQSVPGNAYQPWLDTYADPAFAEATQTAIRLVTQAAARADQPTREAMWRAFEASARHELDFFEVPLRSV